MESRLKQKKTEIVKRWIRSTLESYSADSARFFEREKDPFANPIGNTIAAGLESLFDALLLDAPAGEFVPHLDRVVQIMSIQGYPPSRCLSFVFKLKGIIREELAGENEGLPSAEILHGFDLRVDRLILLALDSYGKFRERMFELRIKEVKSSVAAVLRMAGITDADPSSAPQAEPRLDGSEKAPPLRAGLASEVRGR